MSSRFVYMFENYTQESIQGALESEDYSLHCSSNMVDTAQRNNIGPFDYNSWHGNTTPPK